MAELPSLLVSEHVRAALREDLGRAGDITSHACIGLVVQAHGSIIARKAGILSGMALAKAVFELMDSNVHFEAFLGDGEAFSAGTAVAKIFGPARSILACERVALNYLGHLSGIATLTGRYVEKISHTRGKICATRKTTPLVRSLEKYAVICGGGQPHRYGLDDAILIKDNHIAIAGGVSNALRAARIYSGHLVKIEIEVDNLAQLDEVLALGADVVLLDNFEIEELRAAVARVAGRMRTEASGGVNLDSIAAIAETGVDLISIGALTHSAPNLDLGLDIEPITNLNDQAAGGLHV